MSKTDSLLNKIMNRAAVISFREVDSLLSKCGYILNNKGKTSGSRLQYVHEKSKRIIAFDKPHPESDVPRYVKERIIEALKQEGYINE